MGFKVNLLKIQKFTIHDGPGIRTTVFFKGCPLRCRWCHNPESIPVEPLLMWNKRLCTDCGLCVEPCPTGAQIQQEGIHSIDYGKCTSCGECVKVCMAGALKIHGGLQSVESIMAQLKKDRDYYENSGGGITFSGGEPLAQPDAAIELARACHTEGFNVYLDTSGFASAKVFNRVAAEVDGFLYDLKLMNSELHKTYCGVDNGPILANFRHAIETGKPVRIRVVLTPGLSDTEENLIGLVNLIEETGFDGHVDLMPYHNMGRGKYNGLGLNYSMEEYEAPTQKQLAVVVEFFKNKGISASVQ
ncbi:MAG: glycyl-radical enzyme activating protein [Spirochaetales bacterium]|jgi:pyruvate formate lyase activating enzyme|nr:glycyl-radical enzyme activating protein [Spirochaetales bacterium]